MGSWIELVDFEPHEDSPIPIFPSEPVAFEDTIMIGWLSDAPDYQTHVQKKTIEQNEAQNASTRSERLLHVAQGLTDILTVFDSICIPQVAV